jgi:Flp pilus assembly protein TadD
MLHSILDFDSGLGGSLVRLSTTFQRIVCFDGSNYTSEPVTEEGWREVPECMFSVPPTTPLRLCHSLTGESYRFDAVLALNLAPRVTIEEFATLVDNARDHLKEGGIFWVSVPRRGPAREAPTELIHERGAVAALLAEWGWHVDSALADYLAPDVGAPSDTDLIAATLGARTTVVPVEPPSSMALSATAAAFSSTDDPTVDVAACSDYVTSCRQRFEQLYGVAHRSLLEEGGRFLKSGDLPAAIDRFLQAVKQDPWDVRTWYRLGLAYHAAGQLTDAYCALARALDLSSDADVVLNFARVAAEAGALEEARRALSRLLATEPENQEALALAESWL